MHPYLEFAGEAARILVPLGAGVVAVYGIGNRLIDRALNREFDTLTISPTFAGPLITKGQYVGYRKLIIDVRDSTHVDVKVRGIDTRKAMHAAAKRCGFERPEQRFVLLKPKEETEMGRVVRNALGSYFHMASNMRLAGIEPNDDAYMLYFSVTGSDADTARGAKRLFRVPVIRKPDAPVFFEHPQDRWLFQDEQDEDAWAPDTWSPDTPNEGERHPHRTRLDTVRCMATAKLRNRGRLDSEHVIVFWMRG